MTSRRTKAVVAVLFSMVAAILAGDYVLSRAETRPFGRDQGALPAGTATDSLNLATAMTRVQSNSTAVTPLQNALKAVEHAEKVVMNNIANASTCGFKLSRPRFTDLSYTYRSLPGAVDELGKHTPVGLHSGSGMRVAGTQVDHRDGQLIDTGNPLDLAIVGEGFFQIQHGNEIVYTRCGNFTVNADGEVVLASAQRGLLIEPAITIPPDATDIVVTNDGTVSVRQAGTQTLSQLGQIQTARFVNPQGLTQIGNSLFQFSDAGGPPLLGSPGTDGRGEIRSGFLETSNVNLETELFELQRLQNHRQAIWRAVNMFQE